MTAQTFSKYRRAEYLNVPSATVGTGDNLKETAENSQFELFIYIDKGQIGGSEDAAVRVVGATEPTMMFGM